MNQPLYNLAIWVLTPLIRFFGRMEVIGGENLPPEGGFVLCSNHVSYIDPPVIGCASTRRLHFMAKSELFEIPLLGKVIRKVGTFPVHRGTADRNAIRTAVDLAQSGEVVCLFPEGTRSMTGRLLPPEPGVGMIVTHSKAPVIPAALIGTAKLMRPDSPLLHFCRVKVVFGKPIDYSDLMGSNKREAGNEVATRIMAAIQKLIDENPV